MQPKIYTITCLSCKARRQIGIATVQGTEVIDWLDDNPDPEIARIISGRKRLDNNWGFSCICGNDDIMTKQEKAYIHNKQSPSPSDLTAVIKNLIPQKPKFRMESA